MSIGEVILLMAVCNASGVALAFGVTSGVRAIRTRLKK